MTKFIIWGAYPATLKAVREGVSHINGLGDSLLWWLAALLPHFAHNGYSVEWGDCIDTSDPSGHDDKPLLLLLDLPHTGSAITRQLFDLVPPSRRILMRLEPPAIAPASYNPQTLQMFGALVRVEPSSADVAVSHVLDFNVPLETQLPHLQDPPVRRGLCAVSAHKRIFGPRGELYRLREHIYRQLATLPVSFTLYGGGWNRYVSGIDRLDWLMSKLGIRLQCMAPRGLNYKGPIPDKSDIIHHEYTLVIENHIGSTYISEKPFDSLKYGVVPIYYGGVDLCAQGLHGIVLQARDPQDIFEIALNTPPALPRQVVQQRYADWLQSRAARKFRIDQCQQDLIKLFNAVDSNE